MTDEGSERSLFSWSREVMLHPSTAHLFYTHDLGTDHQSPQMRVLMKPDGDTGKNKAPGTVNGSRRQLCRLSTTVDAG
ncbi:unnamed protein product [Gadus morhua 'NCC']